MRKVQPLDDVVGLRPLLERPRIARPYRIERRFLEHLDPLIAAQNPLANEDLGNLLGVERHGASILACSARLHSGPFSGSGVSQHEWFALSHPVGYCLHLLCLPGDLGTCSFFDLQSSFYSSSASLVTSPDQAWVVSLNNGSSLSLSKAGTYFVWPVRGGQ